MIKFLITLIVAALLLVAAAVTFAPATLVDRAFDGKTGGKLRVADASGTLWNGTGTLTDARNSWRVPLRWSVDARTVVSDTHVVALAPVDGAAAPTGTVGVGRDAVTLRNFAFDIPAQALSSALALRGAVTLGGTVELRTPEFTWRETGDGAGTLNVRWRDARLVAAGVPANLGIVEIALAPQGNQLAGRIASSGGDVRIDGTLTLGRDAAGIDVLATPSPTAPPNIARVLALMGSPDAGGAVRIGWRGNLK